MVEFKIFGTCLVLFCALALLIVMWSPKKSKMADVTKFKTTEPCFEMKLVYDEVDGKKVKYNIAFTNDNWISRDLIREFNDYTKSMGYISVFNCPFSGGVEKATEYAAKFESFEECTEHNRKVDDLYKQRLEEYKEQGILSISEKHELEKVNPKELEILIKSCK